MKSAGHAGAGLFSKSYMMADEQAGDDAASLGAGSTARLDPSDRGRALRLHLYRKATEALGALARPALLGELEALFRERLNLKACKGVDGRFHLPAMFRLLDRSGRGGFDLEDFRQATELFNVDFNEAQIIALFAK
jgi:hypothetical protein